ncbi:MAG: type III pantothenate kinase [Planctomycetes bacterium]|nr:type III pantothenate kinase [Planctomycetota bacterium]
MTSDGLLLLDIGNSQLKSCWQSHRQSFAWRDHIQLKHFAECLNSWNPQLVVLLSSAPQIDEKIEQLLAGYQVKRIVASDVPLKIKSKGTGIDRLVAAFAATHKSSSAVIVVDLGTAFTIDVVDEHHNFRGGAIGPGLSTQLEALKNAAPHLAAPLRGCEQIPKSTAAAVHDGTYQALAISLQSLVCRYSEDLGTEVEVFICGGDAEVMLPLLPQGWRHQQYLLFDGMNDIAQQFLT